MACALGRDLEAKGRVSDDVDPSPANALGLTNSQFGRRHTCHNGTMRFAVMIARRMKPQKARVR